MSKERLQLDFSKNGEGRILMTAIGNTLYLDKIKKDAKLGDQVDIKDEEIEKVLELNFYKTESIDILIHKLIAIKNNILILSAS